MAPIRIAPQTPRIRISVVESLHLILLSVCLGLTKRLAACVDDERQSARVRHETIASDPYYWAPFVLFGAR